MKVVIMMMMMTMMSFRLEELSRAKEKTLKVIEEEDQMLKSGVLAFPFMGMPHNFYHGFKPRSGAPPSAPSASRLTSSMVSAGELLRRIGGKSLPIARSFLTNALRMEPTNHNAWFNLGLVFKLEGSLQEAADCFQKACELKESSPIMNFRVLLFFPTLSEECSDTSIDISSSTKILNKFAGAKVVATALCKGSGLVGGLYAPILMIGAAIGAVLGVQLQN